ncbi:MAG TPA: hypothetical protein VKM94_24305 [Blastocatellia bacterium]|nr:hypothetical protein [Blastocatellia bacterium]
MDTNTHGQQSVEAPIRWGLVILAGIAALGALLRMFSASSYTVSTRLDQTTLLYLGVAGALLLLRQVKTFSLGQFKFELIEKLRERQDKQEERLADIALILPLLLPDREVNHIKKLFAHTTAGYRGSHPLRGELRRLRSMGLLTVKAGRTVADMKDGIEFDLSSYVDLTELGRRWATRIQEIYGTELPTQSAVTADEVASP